MSWRSRTFKPVRRNALKHWLKETKRHRSRRSDDDFSDSYECRWQARAMGDVNAEDMDGHVALFCGIGEFASHVTDLLLDHAQDNLRFGESDHRSRLARHYYRLMFIVAELLNDFEAALKCAGVSSVREYLGASRSVEDFHVFVNKVVKHKAEAIHRHDQHLPIGFMDAGDEACERTIQLGTRDFTGNNQFDCILVPSLSQILDLALTAYRKFDELIENDDAFRKVCANYQNEQQGEPA